MRAVNQQPKEEARHQDVEMIIDTNTKNKKSDSIYQQIEIEAVLDEMSIGSTEPDVYLSSWANADYIGELDEFVNKPKMAFFKQVCDKILKEQGLQDHEKADDAKDVDFNLEEIKETPPDSKRKSQVGRRKQVRDY